MTSRADEPDLLRRMVLIRRFEAALMARPDRGFQLFSSGEEAVAVGLCAALCADDQLLSSGRSIGPALARGLDPGAVMAELVGRTTGPCKGKGGRGHLAQPSAGFFGAHAVVGGNLTIAAGVALAMRLGRRRGVVACIFGDGACGAGALHETLNLAALWKLPLVLVGNDNGWAISTPREEAIAATRLADFAAPFGIPAATVDGTDVVAVRDAAHALVAHARAGGGPAFLECRSVRLLPHSTATRETRSPAALAAARKHCPIEREAARLATIGVLDAAERTAIEREVDFAVDAACRYADASPLPEASEVDRDVD